jgi:hypothetical protein
MLEQSKTYTAVTRELQRMAEEFLATGVTVVTGIDFSGIEDDDWKAKRRRYDQQRMPLMSLTAKRSFIRQVAKDLARPVVIAEKDGRYGPDTRVTFKHIKRNAPLIAHYFMLLGESVTPRWDKSKKKQPVEVSQDKTNWYVNFNGKKGAKELDSWLTFLKTDPACRAALKLSPLTQGSNNVAHDLDDRDPRGLRHQR